MDTLPYVYPPPCGVFQLGLIMNEVAEHIPYQVVVCALAFISLYSVSKSGLSGILLSFKQYKSSLELEGRGSNKLAKG